MAVIVEHPVVWERGAAESSGGVSAAPGLGFGVYPNLFLGLGGGIPPHSVHPLQLQSLCWYL